MSDEWGPEGGAAVAAPSPGPTAGALLRQAREACGLHIAALAVALKVPVRKLEALEEDRYDLMTDAVFVRGLAASVCRQLKIDPQPVLERLPQTTAPRLVRDNEGINAPFRAPSDGPPASWRQQLTRPVFLAVAALLLAALVVVLVPVTQRGEGAKVASRQEMVPQAPLPAAVSAPLPAPVETPAPMQEPAPLLTAAASMPGPAAAAEPRPAAAPAAAPAVVAPASAAATAATGAEQPDGIVVFRAKGPSWVEVTDAKGVVAMRKVLAAGEAAAATGALPLHVTIGRSDMTDVQVRGKPFDLTPHQRGDNVARFDVK